MLYGFQGGLNFDALVPFNDRTMFESEPAHGDLRSLATHGVQKMLDTIWDGVVHGDSKWNPDKSCFELAEEYRRSGRTPSECVRNLIHWQTTKAAAGGFVLGLPGLIFGAVTIPADLTFTTYLQLRMIATIALLYGWDVYSDRVKTVALLSLLGSGATEALRNIGIQVGTKMTRNLLAKVPGRVLIQINKAVATRLVTKAGTTGAVNLTKFVPFAGGVVSGTLNGLGTRRIGLAADQLLRHGPGDESEGKEPPLSPYRSQEVVQ